MRFLALAALPLIAACTHVDEVTPRSYVGMLMGDTAAVREKISEALAAGATLPHGPLVLSSSPEHTTAQLDFGWIANGGAIVVRNKTYDVTVVLEPSLSEGKVEWKCVVSPPKAAPTFCAPT